MEKENKDIFFVEVHEPYEVKRIILESLKDIVESLQRFEKFKEIRRGINVARNDLKKAGEVLMKLMDMKDVKDKEFNKWKGTMEDIQKKMVFIDKNLFKGD